MRKMKIFLCYLVILFSFSQVKNYEHLRKYEEFRKSKDCEPRLQFTNCLNERKTIYRHHDLKIRTDFVYCKKQKYIFDYELTNLMTGDVLEYHNNFGVNLIVHKFTLDPGDYKVNLTVMLSNQEVFMSTVKCQVTIAVAPLFPFIWGGFERYVTAGNNLIIDGTNSIDYSNRNPVDTTNIKYNWIYNCDGCSANRSGNGTDGTLIINGNNHLSTARYLVRLGITSKWYNETVYAYQVIHVRPGEPEKFIRCLINCQSEYFDEFMRFRVYCKPGCHEPKWRWSVYLGIGDDQTIITGQQKLNFTNHSNIFYDLHTFPGILPGRIYLIKAAIDTNKTDQKEEEQAAYKIRSMQEHDFACALNPLNGTILETYFTINCNGNGFGSYFWVTLNDKKNKKAMILDFDSSWEYLNFTVPRKGVVSIRFTHYSGLEGEISWDPDDKLEEFTLTDKELKPIEIDDAYNKGNESVENLLKNLEYHKALNKISLVSKSIEKMNPSEMKRLEPVIDDITSDLRKIPMETFSNIQYATGVMEDLTGRNLVFSTALTKKMSSVCRDLSEQHKNLMKEQYFENEAEHKILDTTISELMKCSVGVSQPNHTAIKITDHVNTTTVSYLMMEGETNTEVYDEYMDEVISLENKEAYKSISSDFIQICLNNGETLLNRIQRKNIEISNTRVIDTKEYRLTVKKTHGRSIKYGIYNRYGIIITFPNDMGRTDETYSLLLCQTSHKIFWWENGVEMLSNVVLVKLNRVDGKKHFFQDDFLISFKVNGTFKDNYPSKIYEIKPGISTKYDMPEDEVQAPVYIVTLEAGTSLLIEFIGLEDDISLNVISTDFELPTASHFSGKSQTINKNNRYFVDSVVNDYHGYRLFSVSPGNLNKQIQFKMKAYSVSCLKWIVEKKMWKKSCKATYSANDLVIKCRCKNLSVITGTMEDIQIKEWQKYIPLELNLEMQYFHIINIFMVALYLLYFILLCFSIREVDYTHKTIYFVSDVCKYNLFGYVVVTNTGRAGTTSNVIIRLIGETAESDAHVLNYPDPLLKILQRGEEDWFFVATKVHLGELLEIEIWYDGIGGLPYWFCKKVNVYDIQNDQWYEFRVSSLFSVYPKSKVYVREKAVNFTEHLSSKKKLLKLVHSLRPDFRIFSLRLKQFDENRSYIKRLTLMFSIVISIGFWCIIFEGIPLEAPIDSIMKFGEYKMNYATVVNGIRGSLITAVFHLPIIHIFTTSKVKYSHDGFPNKLEQPLVITILCWSVVIISITVQSTFIICYGVWIPPVDAFLWVTSTLLGLAFYVIVIETIFSILILKIKKNYNEYEIYVRRKLHMIIKDIEKQREILYMLLGKYLLRPFLKHLYKPMEQPKVKYRWMVEKLKVEVRELIMNLIMFVIYTSLMYMVILTNRDHHSVNSNKQISRLMDGSYTKTFALDGIISIKNLEEYIESTLIEATQSRTWYGKYAVRDPGMTNDYSNKMIGVIRIRQYRSAGNSCVVPEIMQFINRSCNDDYFESQDFEEYGLRWDANDHPSEGRMKGIWKFINSSETGTFPFVGKLGVYVGGGYVAFLGRGLRNSYLNLDYLEHYSWFDVLTRGIFIEFLLYNTNSNIFNAVQFTIEKSVTGYLKIEVQVETSKMLVNEKKITTINILLGIFIVIVLFLSIKTLLRIFRTGIWFFKDLWHLIDIVLISLSYACIVLYYKRSYQVGSLLESMEGKEPREFVNYFSLYRVDHAFILTAALLITVATIKLWLLFRFLLVFKVAERMFSIMFGSLCAVVSYHIVALLAFAYCGYVLFVDHLYKFAGIVNTVEFLTELNMRSFSEEERTVLNHPHMGVGYFFYIFYSFTSMISGCIYTAMISIYYSQAKEDLSDYHGTYSVKNYFKTQFLFYYNLAKVRLKYFRIRGGGKIDNNTTPVEPKADEHRYAESFTISKDKLIAMSLVSLCTLKNSNPKRKPLSQRDIRLMTYTLYYLKKIEKEPDNEDEVERFYKADLGGNKVKLLPEFNLTKIEAAASILLGEPKEETMKKLNINGDRIIMEEIKQGIQKIKNELALAIDALNKMNIITL